MYLENLIDTRIDGKGDVFRFFEQARRCARVSDHITPMGAILTYGDMIVSMGHNRKDKTHPAARNFRRSIHAELDCIIGRHRDLLRGTVCWVYREHKNQTLALARPCPDCWRLLSEAGVNSVVYTTEEGFSVEKI